MTRDELIQEAVKERIDQQSKLDKIKQLKQNIEAQTQEIKKLEKDLFFDSMYVPKWEQELKEDIDKAYQTKKI